MAATGVVPVGQLGVVATVSRAIHGLSSRGALGRYAMIANGPGFPRAVANVLSELRLASLDADVVDKLDPDLLSLLRAYEAELTEKTDALIGQVYSGSQLKLRSSAAGSRIA